MTDYAGLTSKLVSVSDHHDDLAGQRDVLDEAIRAIGELRTMTGSRPAESVRDALTFLQEVSISLRTGGRDPAEVQAALLDSAAMIRDLERRWLNKGLLRSVEV